jgi:hypothetical protein
MCPSGTGPRRQCGFALPASAGPSDRNRERWGGGKTFNGSARSHRLDKLQDDCGSTMAPAWPVSNVSRWHLLRRDYRRDMNAADIATLLD